MSALRSKSLAADRLGVAFSLVGPALDYQIDLFQRTILFWDVMRQRGNGYREHLAKTVPHVLRYKVELVADGRTLERPVNYGLVRIVPPAGVTIDPKLRPFVIVDPRAGHGPGIGGFKADSEIGVALRAGHTCYFVGFLPDPMPGQTIEDIARAEAAFLKKVIENPNRTPLSVMQEMLADGNSFAAAFVGLQSRALRPAAALFMPLCGEAR